MKNEIWLCRDKGKRPNGIIAWGKANVDLVVENGVWVTDRRSVEGYVVIESTQAKILFAGMKPGTKRQLVTR